MRGRFSTDCNKAIDLNTRISAYWETRGYARFKLGDLALTLKDCSTAISRSPKSANALFGRSMVRRKAGDKVGGDADMAAAVKLNPDIAKVMAKLGMVP